MLVGIRHQDGKIGIIDVNLMPGENHENAIKAVHEDFPEAKPVLALINEGKHAEA